jgi:hypothetical protein
VLLGYLRTLWTDGHPRLAGGWIHLFVERGQIHTPLVKLLKMLTDLITEEELSLTSCSVESHDYPVLRGSGIPNFTIESLNGFEYRKATIIEFVS